MFGSKKWFLVIFLGNIYFSTSLEDNSNATIENKDIALQNEGRSMGFIIALQWIKGLKSELGTFFEQIHMDYICTAYRLEFVSAGQIVKVFKDPYTTKSSFQRGEFIYSNVTSLYKYTWKDSMNVSYSDYGYNLTLRAAMDVVVIFKANQRGTETFVTFFPSQHWFSNLTNVLSKVAVETLLIISPTNLILNMITEHYQSIIRECEQGNTSIIIPAVNFEPSRRKKGFSSIQNNFRVAFCGLIFLPLLCLFIFYVKSELFVKFVNFKNRNAVRPFSS